MNNVAVNLVATMMQNNFSGKTYQLPNSQGLTHSNFSSVLKQTQTKSSGSSTSMLHREDINQINNGQNVRNQVNKYKEDRIDNKDETNEDKVNASERTIGKHANRDDNRKISNKNAGDNTIQKDEVASNDNKTLVEDNETVTLENSKVNEVTDKVEPTNESEEDQIEAQLTADIAQALGITPEAFGQMLEQMQMTVYNLFNPSKFKAFMQEALSVTSSMDLLVSESSLEKLQNVVEVLKSVSEDTTKVDVSIKLKNALNPENEANDTNESQNLSIRLINSLSSASNTGTSSSSGETLSQMASTTSNALSPTTLSENLDSTFQGILNQVVTQKTETIVMNGTVTTIYTEVTAKDVLDQIVTGMKVQVKEGNSQVVLQLNPENLGKIALSISHEKGVISGQFVAESEAVKKIIESNLNQLKAQLQSQGINVDNLKIVVGDSTAFFAGEQEKGNGKENFESKRSRRISNISNISSTFADTILEEDSKTDSNFIHENSSIELHA